LQAGGAGLLGLSVPIQTGHRWHLPIGGGFKVTPNDWPSMGSVVKRFSQRVPGDPSREVSPYVVVPNFLGRCRPVPIVAGGRPVLELFG
jgi:hypothetical protein